MATAEIVAIGSELLLGQIVDTNSAWMAQRLTALGVNLYFKSVVGDNPARMKEVIARALERADIVITSGGIGPTQDDLTSDRTQADTESRNAGPGGRTLPQTRPANDTQQHPPILHARGRNPDQKSEWHGTVFHR
jgi:hypothetical protein